MTDAADVAARGALLEAVLARLIPGDEHGPGAHETGARAHLERRLIDPDAGHRGQAGLDWLSAQADERDGVPFDALASGRQDELLAALERHPVHARAFELLRGWAIEAFFGLPGPDGAVAGWKLIGYGGPRGAWTAREQQLDELPGPAR